MAKPIRRRDIPERTDPGAEEPLPCSPGSAEQQLDMCEEGELRGDEILHSHGLSRKETADLSSEEGIQTNFSVDMSETDREGDELSGDEHSSGLQGEEPEQPHVDSGVPGRSHEEGEPGVNIRRRRTA